MAGRVGIEDVLDQVSDALVAVDPDGRIVVFNQAAEELFGYTFDEVEGEPVELLVPEEVAGRHPGLVRGFITSGSSRRLMAPERDLIPARRRDGTTFPAAITVGPIDLGTGTTLGMASVRDQTPVVEAERRLREHAEALERRNEELEESERQTRAAATEAREAARRADDIVAQVSDALVAVDPDGRIVLFNRAAEELFGYTFDEVKGEPVELLVPGEVADRHAGLVRGFITSDGSRRLMALERDLLPARRKDGTTFPAAITIGPIDLGMAATLGMAVVRDESSMVEAERALERRNVELEQFLFIAAHDLKEPLRKVESFGTELADALPDLDDWARLCLDRMIDASARMAKLLAALETYSRATAAQEPERCDLADVVADVLVDLSLQIDQSGARVAVGDLPAVAGAPIQLRQLFQNLISNALKFTRPGEPPEVTVYARPTDLPGRLEIVVEDRGIGIDPDYVDRAFEPFRRLHPPGVYEGTGMGLAIAAKVVSLIGGEIRVEPRPDGVGTAMVTTLPAADA
jgi:PAS domain S-box-containing protein